ncbi:RDD family protein [Candidatus Dependentiae bacterium]|nr:RDD family protein [Candidatus Dependentiae bacterium]
METKNLTIMFTDIKGFTSRTSNQSREETLALLKMHDELVRPILLQHKGNIIKTIGDAFLAVFDSPTNALLSGIAIQKNLNKYNRTVEQNKQIELRVAINSGEVIISENDVYGEPVNIAARIENIAEKNEIYFTEAVYLSMNKSEVPSCEIGYRILKGIPNKIKVYKVLYENEIEPGLKVDSKKYSEVVINNYDTAHWGWRLASFLIDLIIMGIISRGLFHKPKLHIIAQALYFIGFWSWQGATPGKMIINLKIVDKETFEIITFKKAVLRFLGYILSILTLGLGFLWIIWDKENQGFHDKLAKTYVLKKNKSK